MVMAHKTKEKFKPKWEGPYVVKMVYSSGAYRLTNPNGNTLTMPINEKFLKKYYTWSCFDLSFVIHLSIKLTLHLWLKLHPDHLDRLGFEIQDAWESAKEELPHSTEHITVN